MRRDRVCWRWRVVFPLAGLLCWGCGGGGGSGSTELGETVAFTAAFEVGSGSDPSALILSPIEPLRGGRVYGAVVTNAVTAPNKLPLQASPAFARLLDKPLGSSLQQPPVALFDDEPTAPGNPYPDARLMRNDGRITVPDRIAVRGIEPELAQARGMLRAIADELQTLRGFSTTSPIRIAVSGPIDLDTVAPDSVLLFERSDAATDLPGLIAEAERRGVPSADVVLAFSFRTQPIGDDLLAIRALLIERARSSPPRLALEDDDPSDGLELGVFTRDDPGGFAAFLAGSPDVALVVHGLMPAPSFLGPDGILDQRKVSGEVPPEEAALDVVVTLPRTGTAPHPVVILQHGFGGSNVAMLPNAALLASRGMATAAISAVQHGRRGNPVALLDSTPLQTRDIFRQSNGDQMQLVRLIESGVDVDGDGAPDLDPDRIGYHGISLGGLLGANLVGIENAIEVAVLTVAGGRIAGLGQAPAIRPIYAGFFAERAGLPADSPEFDVVLDRLLELGQLGMDDGDGLNYARFWHREPLAGVPKRVLLQEGIGDDWVLNDHTEELARAAGIAAQEALSDAAGVCGLWRFDPPDPPRGHSISGRPEVRAQAVHFLASGGTEIVDPERGT
jgi:dienelactone hydrolase